MRAVHDKEIGLSECSAKAVEADSQFPYQKLAFRQHLTTFLDEIDFPHYVNDEIANIEECLKERFEP